MFISIPENFLVPTSYIDPSKLGISLDSSGRFMESDGKAVKAKLDKMLDYLFKRVAEYRNYVTDEELLKIHNEILDTFIETSVNGIECLKALKVKGYKGQSLDDVIALHRSKFTRLFKLHVNKFNCNGGKSPKKSMNPDKLDMAIDKIVKEVEGGVNELVAMAKNLSLPEVIDIYKAGFSKIFSLHANNIDCFKVAKTQKTDGKTFGELEAFHNNKFGVNLGNHTSMLNCK